jgi:hypothetical protein
MGTGLALGVSFFLAVVFVIVYLFYIFRQR